MLSLRQLSALEPCTFHKEQVVAEQSKSSQKDKTQRFFLQKIRSLSASGRSSYAHRENNRHKGVDCRKMVKQRRLQKPNVVLAPLVQQSIVLLCNGIAWIVNQRTNSNLKNWKWLEKLIVTWRTYCVYHWHSYSAWIKPQCHRTLFMYLKNSPLRQGAGLLAFQSI